MSIDNEAKKIIWSLQNNKRTTSERPNFEKTGKKPINRNIVYLFWSILILFLISFVLTFFSNKNIHFCLLPNYFCFNSNENILAYTLYIFINICVVIFAITLAYVLGKKIAKKFNL